MPYIPRAICRSPLWTVEVRKDARRFHKAVNVRIVEVAVVEDGDRDTPDADIVEGVWQRAGRHLVEVGFTPEQVREVMHIMTYLLPRSVREENLAAAREVAESVLKGHRAEIRADFAALKSELIEKISATTIAGVDRHLTHRRWWITTLVGVVSLLVGGLVLPSTGCGFWLA